MTKYNWERLQGFVHIPAEEGAKGLKGYDTKIAIGERRRKTDGDKLSAKGKRKGEKIARVQGICDKQEENFARVVVAARKEERRNKRREERKAYRAAKRAAKV